jgi:hypothetical protein
VPEVFVATPEGHLQRSILAFYVAVIALLVGMGWHFSHRHTLLTATGTLDRPPQPITANAVSWCKLHLREPNRVQEYIFRSTICARADASIPITMKYYEPGPTVVEATAGSTVLMPRDDAHPALRIVASHTVSATVFAATAVVMALVTALGVLRFGIAPSGTPASLPARALRIVTGMTLLLAGIVLDQPSRLFSAAGTHAFGWPIEYAVIPFFALLFSPLLLTIGGLLETARASRANGRIGKYAVLVETYRALLSSDLAAKRNAVSALWSLGYIATVLLAWIAYTSRMKI